MGRKWVTLSNVACQAGGVGTQPRTAAPPPVSPCAKPRPAEGPRRCTNANGPGTMIMPGRSRASPERGEPMPELLANATAAYLLLLLGVVGLMLEMSHPGAWVPGLFGLL